MDAKWNAEKKQYEIFFSERELGILLFSLVIAKYETGDAAVADLQKALLNLNSIGSVVEEIRNK